MAIIVLYPCSQFDYLTSGRTEHEAQELFEAWIASHHPALLEIDSTLPRWETASYPPLNLQQDIVVVPPCCESYWDDNWEQQTAKCVVIRNTNHRDEIVQTILSAKNHESQPFDEDFITDCYAFAVARFLIALMDRSVGMYTHHAPDDLRLKNLMQLAIQMARHNEPGGVQKELQNAFNEIATSKDCYHQTQNYFIELTLVTETTTGESLRQLLQDAGQINLFMPGSVLKTLPETQPDTFSQLQSAVEKNKVRFIVDDTETQSLTLLPILDVVERMLAGLSVYRELLNVSPTVYGRLVAGLSPVLPQVLKLTGIKGAVHFAPLVGWRIPEKDQSKIVWQGMDKVSIDALARYPIDASKYLGFFDFADQFAMQFNQDHVPTTVFALFPGQQSGWLDILRRMNRYTTALGKFVHIEEYFSSTGYAGGMKRYGYDQYPVNALMEPEQNPISQWNERYRKSVEMLTLSSLETLLKLLNLPVAEEVPVVQQFVEAMVPATSVTKTPSQPSGCGSDYIAINPLSFARRVYIDDIAVDVPPMGYAHYKTTDDRRQTAAELETVPPENGKKGNSAVCRLPSAVSYLSSAVSHIFTKKEKPAPTLARQETDDIGRGEKRAVYLLENRYFTAKFDATTGTLRSIFTNRSRYNQLSQQIACRKGQLYTVQCVDEIAITKSTTEVGQLRIAGRLMFPEGELAARFVETVTIRSQSRLLEVDLTLEPLTELDDDRWNSYIAVRYAWNDDGFIQRGNLNDGMHILPDKKHLHSPKLIDLRSEVESLTFLTKGLPFHRRVGDQQLDTLLVVKGETQRQFRLGIGVNVKNPMFLSHDFMLGQEDFILPVEYPPKNSSSWLFQIESNAVVALHWEPVLEEDKVVGYMVCLHETEGRRAHFALRSFLPPNMAKTMDFQGKELKPLKTKDDAVLIEMHAYELLPLMVRVEI